MSQERQCSFSDNTCYYLKYLDIWHTLLTVGAQDNGFPHKEEKKIMQLPVKYSSDTAITKRGCFSNCFLYFFKSLIKLYSQIIRH